MEDKFEKQQEKFRKTGIMFDNTIAKNVPTLRQMADAN